jgi:hypothetical protein
MLAMKQPFLLLALSSVLALLALPPAQAQTKTVTLKAYRPEGQDAFNSPPLVVATNQIAKIVCFQKQGVWAEGIAACQLAAAVSEYGYYLNLQSGAAITGPCVLTINGRPSAPTGYAFAVIEVSPINQEPFGPQMTVVVPRGFAAKLSLESSTNLTAWTEQVSQSLPQEDANRFYRMKLDLAR